MIDEIFLKTIIPSRKATKNYLEKKEELKEYARATIRKDKRVNIRISERDLRELQRISLREGLPYQTLISSTLHKFINGTLIGSK